MANKLDVEEELDYILLPDRIESVGSLEIGLDNLIDYEEDQDCIDHGDQAINQQQKKYK